MRRSLVLTNEASRHPFLALHPRPVDLPRLRALSGRANRARGAWLEDVRDFLLAFCAFFLAAIVFIA